tara:strand:+ start:5189 stop:6127 length:939 start_codon:yes stop_codon:yes gene_type:complete
MASIATEKKIYDLNDFQRIKDDGFDLVLDELTLLTINTLAQRVGAPSYQKTPVFKKKHKPKKQITDDDWEIMRNFKNTELNRNEEGIELEMDKIRIHLNQITKENYDEMKTHIVNILKQILKNKFEMEDLIKVGKSIFEVGSLNQFWSKLYAALYKDLASEFPLMMNICEKNFESFMDLFETIRYVSSDEDYNLFCDINKENSKRQALSSFFVNLMNEKLISTEKVKDLLLSLKSLLDEKINEEGNQDVVNEIIENIVIIVANGSKNLELNEENFWEEFYNYIEEMSESERSDYKSLTSKSLFKLMDLIEEL